MAILNLDTMTSPGIGVLPDGKGFAPLGGCIIDLKGLNGTRLTAQIATSRMFYGWTGPLGAHQTAPWFPNIWIRIVNESWDPGFADLPIRLGGGLAKANFRITLFDGDSGSPNPVYQAMFGAGNFPYSHWSAQPGNFDFDGGTVNWLGFEAADGTKTRIGYMGQTTTYRLGPDYSTVDTFTGFPGVYALTDPAKTAIYTPPPEYLPAFAVTGWLSVPPANLAALYAKLLTGSLWVGLHDDTPGDQFYDFIAGLSSDVENIALIPSDPVALPAPPTIACGNPPGGTVGVDYYHRLQYQANTEFFTLAFVGGSIPPGISMSDEGVFAGSPVMPGTFAFTVSITDSVGQSASVSCSISIAAPGHSGGFGNVSF